MTAQRDAEICGILAKIEPFMIYFDKPHASRERGGVAYPIRPKEPINALQAALHEASVFCRQPYYTRKIPPHMTIAEFVTIEDSWRILEEVKDVAPSGSFLCNKLEYIVPDSSMHFHRVKSYALGAAHRPRCQFPGTLYVCSWRESVPGSRRIPGDGMHTALFNFRHFIIVVRRDGRNLHARCCGLCRAIEGELLAMAGILNRLDRAVACLGRRSLSVCLLVDAPPHRGNSSQAGRLVRRGFSRLHGSVSDLGLARCKALAGVRAAGGLPFNCGAYPCGRPRRMLRSHRLDAPALLAAPGARQTLSEGRESAVTSALRGQLDDRHWTGSSGGRGRVFRPLATLLLLRTGRMCAADSWDGRELDWER